MPAVAGVTANASPNVRRRSRIGFGAGTIAPFGSATTAVIPASGGRFGLRERRVAAVRARLVAAGPAALWSAEARDAFDGRGRVHGRSRGVDGNRPLVADHIPVQLVVIGEREERALHGVGDVVGVDAGDRAVRIADAHLQERSVLGDRRVVGSARARGDAGHVQVVQPVVLRVERLAPHELAVDAVVRCRTEVVDDRLVHVERAVRLDRHVDGVVADAFAGALRARGMREERDAGDRQQDDEERALHAVRSKVGPAGHPGRLGRPCPEPA